MEPALLKQCVEPRDLDTSEPDLSVGYSVDPLDAEDVPHVSEVKSFQLLFLSGSRGSRT